MTKENIWWWLQVKGKEKKTLPLVLFQVMPIHWYRFMNLCIMGNRCDFWNSETHGAQVNGKVTGLTIHRCGHQSCERVRVVQLKMMARSSFLLNPISSNMLGLVLRSIWTNLIKDQTSCTNLAKTSLYLSSASNCQPNSTPKILI